MAKIPKIHDKIMEDGKIRRSNFANYANKNRNYRIKYAKNLIDDLERFGPAGLIHIIVICDKIKRPIKIWNANGTLNRIVGKEKTGHSIDIEYHPSKFIGHWTLRHAKEPDDTYLDLNSCLFSVICSQIREDPLQLRRCIVFKLKNNFKYLVDSINKFQLDRNDCNITLMIGGAKYTGCSASDARIILDNSQNKHSYNNYNVAGHARGHASYPSAIGKNDSVENYSKNNSKKNVKTAFLSRSDQDYVAHLTLKSSLVQNAIIELNTGDKEQSVKVPADELRQNRNANNDLPKCQKFEDGIRVGKMTDIQGVFIKLRHQQELFKNPNADVFVQTFYPLDKWKNTGQGGKRE